MPNYKIFQDIPENLRVKLYASQSGTATALQMESGALIVTTDLVATNSGTTVTVGSGVSSGTTIWDVSNYKEWTYAVKKVSGTGGTEVKLQISATGSGSDWWDQNGTFASISSGGWQYFVSDHYLRYTRIAARTAVPSGNATLHWYFQGQKG